MAFPTALDTGATLPTPNASDKTNSPTHAGLHGAVNTAVIAVETKLGIGASTPVANTLLFGNGTGTSAWTAITSANLRATLTDETGTGSAVFATSPTLTTPAVDTINESTPTNGVTIDGLNLKDSKLNTNNSVVTANITDLAVTNAKIADDTITGAKINFAGTGADSGVWWEEVARTTLSGASDTITVSSIPARKYYYVYASAIATGGTLDSNIRFNNDSAANYNMYETSNTGAGATTGAVTSIPEESGATDSGGLSIWKMEVFNIAVGTEKSFMHQGVSHDAAGAATVPTTIGNYGKWANTSALINRIDWLNLTGTGDFAIGSEVIVLGHN